LDQRSEFGARLDSIADMVMYTLLLGGLVLLEGEVLAREWPWLVPALGGYALSWLLSLVKFGQMPSYHTLTAKASYFLVIGATIGLLAGDLVWPVRVAAAGVTTANLEAVLLTLTLDAPRSDVPSILTLTEGDGAKEDAPVDG
jgi:CDP-diacylglycerol--glycerol-3-phosphate 3-phosphatidyltransferase